MARFIWLTMCFCSLLPLLRADDKDSLRFITHYNRTPGIRTSPAPATPDFRKTNELALAGEALLSLYQAYLSPLDMSACPFTPTCSEYARQAIEKYGLIAGVIMAADRLQRDNGLGDRFYPRDPQSGRLLDPP
jgi:putative component of membrane protein insertase Oxa1/YidC/SpoIIIJ protein YidD